MLTLPPLNRRRLLLGLASASAAGAAIVAAGTAAEVIPEAAPAENAALLQLGDQLASAVEELKDAEASFQSILRTYEPIWPMAPAALEVRYFEEDAFERGLQGQPIMPNGAAYVRPTDWRQVRVEPHPRCLITAERLRHAGAEIDRKLRRRRPKHPLTIAAILELEAERAQLVDRLAIAERYEADCIAFRERSGYAAASKRTKAAVEALKAAIAAVMAEKPVTMAGVLIQAEALEALDLLPFYQLISAVSHWPQDLAASLLRIAREAPTTQA